MEAIGRIETVEIPVAERSRPSIAVEKLGDLPPLTGLRFFAAFFVFVGHATPMMLKLSPSPQLVINVTNCIIEVGMELFFVLSGFVIHYNYADIGRPPNSQNLARFYIARFARIYPLYVLFLVLLHVLYGGDLRATAFFLGMTQSWVFVLFGGVPLYAHLSAFITWSISTEWFFYCLYPVVAWLLAMTRHRLTAALLLVGLGIVRSHPGRVSLLARSGGQCLCPGCLGATWGRFLGMADSFIADWTAAAIFDRGRHRTYFHGQIWPTG